MQSPDFLNSTASFEEVKHTADWAYRVWGQNLTELFIQVANGLYAIASVQLATDSPINRNIQLKGVDYESLLVAWLNELLYLHESESLGFNPFDKAGFCWELKEAIAFLLVRVVTVQGEL